MRIWKRRKQLLSPEMQARFDKVSADIAASPQHGDLSIADAQARLAGDRANTSSGLHHRDE